MTPTVSWRFTARKERMPSRRPFWSEPSYSVGVGDGEQSETAGGNFDGRHACLSASRAGCRICGQLVNHDRHHIAVIIHGTKGTVVLA